MGHVKALGGDSAANPPLPACATHVRSGPHAAAHDLKNVLGMEAWARLPTAVQARFSDSAQTVDYTGEFEIVRASSLGRLIAWACRLIGTPVAPHIGQDVPAVVRVRPTDRGVEWRREYRWPDRRPSIVRSTKVIESGGTLVEELSAGLCMSLKAYEAAAGLHFVSHDYYFHCSVPLLGVRVRLVLPRWLSPGTTHVEHIDLADGWFRFTMTVTHPLLGEVFHQSGCFRSSGD
jgi:hypothetical protein